MDRRRSVSMDVSVSIPAAVAASMLDKESMSDDKISIIIPHRSPSNKILPLGFRFQQNDDEPSSPGGGFLKRVALPLAKKAAAELLGTFLLVFAVLSALVTDEAHGGALGAVGVAAAAGLALFVVVSSLAHVSGGHVNPAVSVAMAAFGHLPRAHLAPYVAAQLLGATAASFAAKALYYDGPATNMGAAVATVPSVGSMRAFWIEFVATFVFLFVVTALATDPKAVKELVAVGAGAAVMMDALVFGKATGASMNPARTLGPAIATGTYTKIWVYMVAPPLGAIAGSGAYHALK